MPNAIEQLDASTWPAFADLVERNNVLPGIKHRCEYQKNPPPPAGNRRPDPDRSSAELSGKLIFTANTGHEYLMYSFYRAFRDR